MSKRNNRSLPEGLHFVDIQKHWRKIGPIARSDYARAIWLPDMTKYRAVRQLDCLEDLAYLGWGDDAEFTNAPFPSVFDSCDWRLNRRGRHPAFWEFVCYQACHWLVNLNLFLASAVMPKLPWRIATSAEHSTVWDGNDQLFDMNFLGLGVPPKDAWDLANSGAESEHLPFGCHHRLEPWDELVEQFVAGEITKDDALEIRFGGE